MNIKSTAMESLSVTGSLPSAPSTSVNSRLPPWRKQNKSPAPEPSTEMEFVFLNDKHFTRAAAKTTRFTCFPDLPIELRLHIWKLALPNQRLLSLVVYAADSTCAPLSLSAISSSSPPNLNQNQGPAAPLYEARNALGNLVSGAPYVLHMRSRGSVSALLGVNCEANRAVHEVYRVALPVGGRVDGSAPSSLSCLRFNPETDTIQFEVASQDGVENFAHVVHDAMAHDPLRLGILHIAFGSGDEQKSPLLLDPASVHARARKALSTTLINLRSLKLIHITTRHGRCMTLSPPGFRMNHCLPIWSDSASFTLLSASGGADPRPLNQDAVGGKIMVTIGRNNPRTLIHAWRAFEAAFDVPPRPVESIQILLAAPTVVRGVGYDTHRRAEACSFRADEEVWWERQLKLRNIVLHNREEKVEHARTNNAVGFWLLPHELLPDDSTEGLDPEAQYIVELTNVKPQLGLFEMAGA